MRAAFDYSARADNPALNDEAARIAMSCEALRTTTRMMHAIAWLLNHRAYLAGEMSEFQLRRHGRLAPDFPMADPERTAMLSPDIRELIVATEQFYARLLRIDRGWRDREPSAPAALDRLRERLGGLAQGFAITH